MIWIKKEESAKTIIKNNIKKYKIQTCFELKQIFLKI